ncbi:hypothetical protein C0995_012909 [Termitomyces sp. Mi166|nr:hypothetical protein C0995_012909 [Termitomyces sp. Mi166\
MLTKSKEKGKAKAVKKDEDKDEATRQLCLELENFVVLTTVRGHADAAIESSRAAFEMAWVSEYRRSVLMEMLEISKEKSRMIMMKKTSIKHTFKSKEIVKSDSNEEDEEKRICTFKKVKHKHMEKLTGKEKEVDRMQMMMVSKVLVIIAKPSCSTPSKLVVVIFLGVPKPKIKVPTTPLKTLGDFSG